MAQKLEEISVGFRHNTAEIEIIESWVKDIPNNVTGDRKSEDINLDKIINRKKWLGVGAELSIKQKEEKEKLRESLVGSNKRKKEYRPNLRKLDCDSEDESDNYGSRSSTILRQIDKLKVKARNRSFGKVQTNFPTTT
ncbi:uncharacterized protein CMU_000570 [Cryptosporidium muris RN66]|uniref:Uncharacterized protein n=1 Tax=Cryptosporidium muris (strain RN66) TaxID=441375 RepID=B6AG46_CRYMR|nr:uncharacterized protein CMU_000570 [Cryptosporidium muris RN66]EEA07187.1 hypothetical protein CMU_000570 [Cryptosporidium muris RN66]|eukprot:XP_002141536.1 hypothetical protein [Cryptosporidium muris RN66]